MSIKLYNPMENLLLIQEDSTKFTLNCYLLSIFSKNKQYKILIDPLPYKYHKELLDVIKENWKKEDAKFIFITHEESGILSSVPEILKLFPEITIIASNDMWKFLNIYGIREEQFHPIEFIPNKKVKFEFDEMQFYPVPFCTSNSSYIVYYRNRNILFSGNFLSGYLVNEDNKELYASESSILGIKIFHETHIPHNLILKNAFNNLGVLEDIPEIIFPHHGYVIKRDLLEKIYKELNDLKVGIEYMRDSEFMNERYLLAINEFIKEGEKELGHKYILSKLQKLNVSSSLYMELFKIEGGIITEVRISPSTAFELIVKEIKEDLEPDQRMFLDSKIKTILEKYELDNKRKEGQEWFIPKFEKFLESFSKLHGLYFIN